MKLPWMTKLSLFVYKHITGPLTDGLVNAGQHFFVWLDRKTGNEVPPITEEEELNEYRNQMKLQKDNIPEGLRHLLPLVRTWGIVDDAIRSSLVKSATEDDRRSLVTSVNDKTVTIDEWLDTFPEGEMTEEAEAFMYLLETVEELSLDGAKESDSWFMIRCKPWVKFRCKSTNAAYCAREP